MNIVIQSTQPSIATVNTVALANAFIAKGREGEMLDKLLLAATRVLSSLPVHKTLNCISNTTVAWEPNLE